MTPQPVSPAMRRFIVSVDHAVMFIARHWLLIANVSLFVFIGLPFLAPILMHYGYTGPAELIYRTYKLTCHQLAYRSFFLFGQQSAYTIDQLRALLSVHNEDFLYWTFFQGNLVLGYKMAWCERDAAIYGSMLISSLIFGLVRTRVKPLDWRLYLVLMTPMAIDGFTQLFGWRESTYELRVITGVLFGVGSVWTLFPHLEMAMREAAGLAQTQWEHARAHEAALRAR
ncbi:MAG: DUF2085 domain-containing protein [Chloroflexi bacterium]|nr:DUF2085 domain-containing protein [Chloroflexota bacterium]